MIKKSKSLSIEFTGVAGVGKSTLINELFSLLNEKGISYSDLTSFKGKKFTLNNLLPIIKALYLTLIIKPKTLFGGKKIFMNLAKHQMICRSSDKGSKLQIYDEGVFHKARALRRYSKETGLIKIINKFFKFIDPPDVLVILEANPDVIFERRTNRNRDNDFFDYESIIKETKDIDLEKTLDILKYEKNYCVKDLKVIRLQNDNDHDIAINANKIIDKLNNEGK